jgi:hypothetical protein
MTAVAAAFPILALADSSAAPTTTGGLLANLFAGCWACGAFNTLGAIGLSFADAVFMQLANGMTILIGLFMALWILYFAARLFLPFGPPGAGHWNIGAEKLFKLLLVLAFLQSSAAFWNYIFTPVLSGALGIASTLATASDKFEGQYGMTSSVPGGALDYCNNPAPDTGVDGLTDTTKAAVAALEQMDCPMSRIQSQFGKGIMIGVSVIGEIGCVGNWFSGNPAKGFIPLVLAGAILIVLFGFGYLVFPFLLIDVLMRVILVAATSPLAIASILFKPTAKIAERSLWTLVHCGFTLMFGAAVAGIGKAMMAYVLSQMAPAGGQVSFNNWDNLSNAIENSCNSNFSVNFASASFYMLCGTALVMIFMIRRAGSLAGELTSISGSTGAQAAGAAILGAAAGAVGRAGKLAANYAVTRAAFQNRSKASQVTGTEQK